MVDPGYSPSWIQERRDSINLVFTQKQFLSSFSLLLYILPHFFGSSVLGLGLKAKEGLQPEEKFGLQGQVCVCPSVEPSSFGGLPGTLRRAPAFLSEASLGHEPSSLPSAMEMIKAERRRQLAHWLNREGKKRKHFA